MGADPGAGVNELAALAAGRWAGFQGLAECEVAVADAELGPPLEDELHGGMFGGEPAQFRRYPATDAAPTGITCWVLGDLLVGVEIHDPEPAPDALAALGPAPLVLESELGPSWSQEVWPDRGLVIHRRDDRFGVLLGLAKIDPEEWLSDPLRWWRIERHRR